MVTATETTPKLVKEKPPKFREIIRHPDGTIDVKLNMHRGQARAWDSTRRFIALLMGTQSGKTVWGAEWLKREIEMTYDEDDDTNDYLAVTATHNLMKMKMLPQLRYLFETLWKKATYHAADKVFIFHDSNIQIFLGSAQNPESLESATAKAAWMDEAGQNQFKRETWEAVQRRLSIASEDGGRVLFTTTLYNLGWLKSEIYDHWLKQDAVGKHIDVIQEDSIVNPRFPIQEYRRAMATKPKWYFDMFYRGRYSRPPGLIYDCFDSKVHIVPRFDIPNNWPRYVGVDFAGPNGKTAAVWMAMDPTGHFYLYREYVGTGKTAADHVKDWKKDEKTHNEIIIRRQGGSHGEEGWREDYGKSGCPIMEPPVKEVEVGILSVYGYIKTGKFSVMDDCLGWIDEIQRYSHELDEKYEPTEKIADKEEFHFLDATRYIMCGFSASYEAFDEEIQVQRFN